MTTDQWVFVVCAFGLQAVLLIYFALRKWAFDVAMRLGWIVYVLALPVLLVSLWLLWRGQPWWLVTGGLIYGGWALFGWIVDLRLKIPWRGPIYWPVFMPYVLIFTAWQMFYWWPMWRIQRDLWFLSGGLFVLATALNAISHEAADPARRKPA